MLQITIPAKELWDEQQQKFITVKGQTLQLEHSLVSLSKWESKWCKPFLGKEDKTYEETIDYIQCMTITQNVDPDIYKYLSDKDITKINNYIAAPMTATTITEMKSSKSSSEIITSELIYYWMVALNIPFECQKWHLNRLITLVRVCNAKNEPPKKMGRQSTANRYAAVNAARRKKLGTRG